MGMGIRASAFFSLDSYFTRQAKKLRLGEELLNAVALNVWESLCSLFHDYCSVDKHFSWCQEMGPGGSAVQLGF